MRPALYKPLSVMAILAVMKLAPAACQESAAVPEAPPARTNWAVALSGGRIYTFYGLSAGKTFRDITRDVHRFDPATREWARIGEVPVAEGRLASSSITIAGTVYLIGGYTVSPKGDEHSAPEILSFDPGVARFSRETSIPTPVDDTVALPWRDRWIVLISGWHDTGNVADVQLYDTVQKRWIVGTAWRGTPVFGHAGGIVGDQMVICDGVTATRDNGGKKHFAMSDACWHGQLEPRHPGQILWTLLPAHPGKPLYRAGASGISTPQLPAAVVFAGGSETPYNYDGIGYNGEPAAPSDAALTFSFEDQRWRKLAPLPSAGMDFRGLVAIGPVAYLLGGMAEGQRVSAGSIQFTLP